MATRVPTFKGSVGTFRSPGVAAVDSTLLSVFNKTGSGVLVAIRRITLEVDQAGASATQRNIKLSRLTTAPTTGTLLTPQAWDTNDTHNANVEIRGRASADGTNGTLTATPTTAAKVVMGTTDPSAVGQMLMPDRELLPDYPSPEDPLVLREGEGVLVSVIQSGSTAAHYLLNVMIEEFTYSGGTTSVSPDPVAIAIAFPTPTVTAGRLVSPTPLAIPIAFTTPVVTAGRLVSPSPVAFTLAFPDPTVTAGAGATSVSPDPVAFTFAFPAPTVTAGRLVSPSPVAIPLAFPTPTVTSGRLVSPTPLAVTFAFAAPTVTAGRLVSPSPVVITWAFPAPTVTAGARVAPDPVAFTLAFPDPTVTAGAGGGATSVTPDPLVIAIAFPAPTLITGVLLAPAPVAFTIGFAAPTVTAAGVVTPPPDRGPYEGGPPGSPFGGVAAGLAPARFGACGPCPIHPPGLCRRMQARDGSCYCVPIKPEAKSLLESLHEQYGVVEGNTIYLAMRHNRQGPFAPGNKYDVAKSKRRLDRPPRRTSS